MRKLPIPFSGPMVAAILREIRQPGTGKTQTRRAIPQSVLDAYDNYDDWCSNVSAGVPTSRQWEKEFFLERCRYAVGDLLWVRESIIKTPAGIAYAADGASHYGAGGKLRATPSIHMPRTASRITLRVVGVKVERLQDISEADAEAEGVIYQNVITDVHCAGGVHSEITADRYWNGTEPEDFEGHECATDAFADLWNQINGPGSWEANPWVAAYSFEPIFENVDKIGGGGDA